MRVRLAHGLPWLAAACVALAAPHASLAQDKPPAATLAANPRGVYAAIDLRPTQEMVVRLGAAYGSDHRLAIRTVRGDAGAYAPPVLYALANTLAEDHAEEAIFWYQVGRIRAVYDSLRCRDASARAGVAAIGQSLNLELRSSMFYRRERLVAIAQKAIDWDTKNPRSYEQRWIALYGKVAATSAGTDANEIMVPESEWPALLKHVHETHLKSVADFAAEKGAK